MGLGGESCGFRGAQGVFRWEHGGPGHSWGGTGGLRCCGLTPSRPPQPPLTAGTARRWGSSAGPWAGTSCGGGGRSPPVPKPPTAAAPSEHPRSAERGTGPPPGRRPGNGTLGNPPNAPGGREGLPSVRRDLPPGGTTFPRSPQSVIGTPRVLGEGRGGEGTPPGYYRGEKGPPGPPSNAPGWGEGTPGNPQAHDGFYISVLLYFYLFIHSPRVRAQMGRAGWGALGVSPSSFCPRSHPGGVGFGFFPPSGGARAAGGRWVCPPPPISSPSAPPGGVWWPLGGGSGPPPPLALCNSSPRPRGL